VKVRSDVYSQLIEIFGIFGHHQRDKTSTIREHKQNTETGITTTNTTICLLAELSDLDVHLCTRRVKVILPFIWLSGCVSVDALNIFWLCLCSSFESCLADDGRKGWKFRLIENKHLISLSTSTALSPIYHWSLASSQNSIYICLYFFCGSLLDDFCCVESVTYPNQNLSWSRSRSDPYLTKICARICLPFVRSE
jgi:hypothetical protein